MSCSDVDEYIVYMIFVCVCSINGRLQTVEKTNFVVVFTSLDARLV